jgi:hypothetical protein
MGRLHRRQIAVGSRPAPRSSQLVAQLNPHGRPGAKACRCDHHGTALSGRATMGRRQPTVLAVALGMIVPLERLRPAAQQLPGAPAASPPQRYRARSHDLTVNGPPSRRHEQVGVLQRPGLDAAAVGVRRGRSLDQQLRHPTPAITWATSACRGLDGHDHLGLRRRWRAQRQQARRQHTCALARRIPPAPSRRRMRNVIVYR